MSELYILNLLARPAPYTDLVEKLDSPGWQRRRSVHEAEGGKGGGDIITINAYILYNLNGVLQINICIYYYLQA